MICCGCNNAMCFEIVWCYGVYACQVVRAICGVDGIDVETKR